jgi:hypothetical protein
MLTVSVNKSHAFVDILFKLGIDVIAELADTGFKKMTSEKKDKISSLISEQLGVKITSIEDKIIFPRRFIYVLTSKDDNQKVIIYTANRARYDYIGYGVSDGAELTEMQALKNFPEEKKIAVLTNAFRKYKGINLLPSTAEEITTEAARSWKQEHGSQLVFTGTSQEVQLGDHVAVTFPCVSGSQFVTVALQKDGQFTGHFFTVSTVEFARMTEEKVELAKAFNERTYGLDLSTDSQH